MSDDDEPTEGPRGYAINAPLGELATIAAVRENAEVLNPRQYGHPTRGIGDTTSNLGNCVFWKFEAEESGRYRIDAGLSVFMDENLRKYKDIHTEVVLVDKNLNLITGYTDVNDRPVVGVIIEYTKGTEVYLRVTAWAEETQAPFGFIEKVFYPAWMVARVSARGIDTDWKQLPDKTLTYYPGGQRFPPATYRGYGAGYQTLRPTGSFQWNRSFQGVYPYDDGNAFFQGWKGALLADTSGFWYWNKDYTVQPPWRGGPDLPNLSQFYSQNPDNGGRRGHGAVYFYQEGVESLGGNAYMDSVMAGQIIGYSHRGHLQACGPLGDGVADLPLDKDMRHHWPVSYGEMVRLEYESEVCELIRAQWAPGEEGNEAPRGHAIAYWYVYDYIPYAGAGSTGQVPDYGPWEDEDGWYISQNGGKPASGRLVTQYTGGPEVWFDFDIDTAIFIETNSGKFMNEFGQNPGHGYTFAIHIQGGRDDDGPVGNGVGTTWNLRPKPLVIWKLTARPVRFRAQFNPLVQAIKIKYPGIDGDLGDPAKEFWPQ